MQSETADFAPSAATWRTIRKNVFCDSVLFGPLFENMTPSTDLKYITYCIAPGEHQATATGNVYKKLMKFGLRFLSRYAGGQTDRHGDTLLAVLFAPNGGEMKQHNQICIQLSITYRPMDGLLHSSWARGWYPFSPYQVPFGAVSEGFNSVSRVWRNRAPQIYEPHIQKSRDR